MPAESDQPLATVKIHCAERENVLERERGIGVELEHTVSSEAEVPLWTKKPRQVLERVVVQEWMPCNLVLGAREPLMSKWW